MTDLEELKRRLYDKKPISVPQNVMVLCHEAGDAIESLQAMLLVSGARAESAEAGNVISAAEIERLRHDLEQARRDAERYRWLRSEGFDRPATIWVTWVKTQIPVVHSDLDEAIDAARQQANHPDAASPTK